MLLSANSTELSEDQVTQPEVFLNVAEVRLLQLEKAYRPMLVTPLPIVTEVKLLQPEQAEDPILDSESGIVSVVLLLLHGIGIFP